MAPKRPRIGQNRHGKAPGLPRSHIEKPKPFSKLTSSAQQIVILSGAKTPGHGGQRKPINAGIVQTVVEAEAARTHESVGTVKKRISNELHEAGFVSFKPKQKKK